MPSRPPLQRKIHGLDCAEEVALLKRELLPVVGDDARLSFDLLRAKLTVEIADTPLSEEEIDTAIARTGLRSERWHDAATQPPHHASRWKSPRSLLTVISGVGGITGWWLQTSSSETIPVLAVIAYSIGIVAGLVLVLPKAWRSLVARRPDMNLLMSIAVVGAIAIGEWTEAATVAFLFSLSLLLESWSIGRARRAIESLMQLTPPVARELVGSSDDELGIVESHEIVEKSPSEVAVGAVLQVRAGDKIPLDGLVLRGVSDVNESPITGESVPVEKNPGDSLYAGTINGDGVLTMRTTKTADDTTLARIIRLVSEAGSKRAASEQWVEKFAAIYTPIVFSLAILVMLVPPLLLGGQWSDWIYRALVLLVIACPCALVISTPVSVISALTSAARKGVLIKGGVFIELPAHLNAIAFDKTGTLTVGEPAVSEWVVSQDEERGTCLDQDALLAIAAAIGSQSNHPLSLAIAAYASARGITPAPVHDVVSVPGKGTTATVDGRTISMGSPRFMKERSIDSGNLSEQLAAPDIRRHSLVLIGDEDRVLGYFTLTDPVRGDAHDAIAQLRASGIATISMLTGDHNDAAMAVAEETGIEDVHSQLLPEDKVEVIGLMVEEYGNVAMVGDGVNDAPALAIATLGIAMGGTASDAAIETADVTLMSGDLRLLPWLRNHSIRTLRIIRQNIVFALSIKALFVLLTFFGYASLWAAIAADTGASLLVIFNALRLLRTDDPDGDQRR